MKLPRIGKKHFLLYVSIAAALSVVSITIAWFSANRLLESNNMGMAAYGSNVRVAYRVATDDPDAAYTEITPNDPLSLASEILHPGDSLTYQIKITNIGDEPVDIASFGVSKPTDAEETANNKGYFFGTQIQVQLLEVVNGTLPADTTAQYLAKYKDPAAKELEEPTDIPLWNGKIPNKASESADETSYSVVLTVRFTFENKNIPQNEYISFGKDGDGVCKRRFYIRFNLDPDSSAPNG